MLAVTIVKSHDAKICSVVSKREQQEERKGESSGEETTYYSDLDHHPRAALYHLQRWAEEVAMRLLEASLQHQPGF